MRHLCLLSILALPALVYSDVHFTYPTADDTISAGPITIKWKDSGIAPSISTLEGYTLQLIVGGNDPTAAHPLLSIGSPGLFAQGNEATGVIPVSIAQSLQNGFYLQIISTAKDGGTVTNYSPRFSITGLTGTTDEVYVKQVQALGGSSSGPATVNNVVPKAAPAVAGFGVPYNEQVGPTRYAPMQPVPPTKITAGNPTPLYPTSAFTIARAALPPPQKVITTLTEPQTYSVHSIENTIAAQSRPTGDMAKFLARWKD